MKAWIECFGITSTPPKRAVKRLFKKGLDARQLMLQRQEAAVMKALDGHNNIVRLLATVEDEECLYLIMEYCELDLYEAITQQGGFPEDVVKEVFGQIADAVLYCHSKGYFHRDLKPENCLISTSDYKIKLADFGLATTDTWSTEMGCGSVRYMAPECFEAGHNQTDPATTHFGVTGPDGQPVVGYQPAANDVWALGVILLNLLFGKNPWFEAFPTDAIFSAFAGGNPGILRQQFDLSPHFDSVLRRCFDLDPRRRCTVHDLKVMVESLPRFVGGGVPVTP
ncbi:kinase-like domain-containing protein, partial [Chytridium lagenaria]